MQALSREARSNQRRLLTAFGIDTDSDLLKFNQLKVCHDENHFNFSFIESDSFCKSVFIQVLSIDVKTFVRMLIIFNLLSNSYSSEKNS